MGRDPKVGRRPIVSGRLALGGGGDQHGGGGPTHDGRNPDLLRLQHQGANMADHV